MKRYQYDKQGMLAINPRAFFGLFSPIAQDDEPKIQGGAAIVEICGPLEHHSGWWCDSYDAIHSRVQAALASAADVVILKIDSPGGDVAGCFDTARELRALADAASKRMIAYVDGQACSAAYALACASDEIVVPETGFVGSIGVINTRVDLTALNEAQGVRFALVTSGARKADGNPNKAISEAELTEVQAQVDSLAEVFFDFVRERRGIDPAPLEARVLHGKAAVAAKLADRVASFDQLLASLADAENPQGGERMASKYEEARAALEKAAEGDDEDAKRAKRALAAMDEDEGDEAKAEDGDEPDEDDKKKKEDEASASVDAKLAAQVQKLSAEVTALKAQKVADERAAFLASRPDLAPELVAALKDEPLAKVKAIVGAVSKKAEPAATAGSVPATRGEGQGEAPEASTDLDTQMDIMMGLKPAASSGVRREAGRVTFGVITKPANTAAKAAQAAGGAQ